MIMTVLVRYFQILILLTNFFVANCNLFHYFVDPNRTVDVLRSSHIYTKPSVPFVRCVAFCAATVDCCSANYDIISSDCTLYSDCCPVRTENVGSSIIMRDKTSHRKGTPFTSCQPNWQLFEGHCYLLECQKQVTWIEAKTRCEGFQSYLISIDSLPEKEFFQTNLTCSKSENTWVGISDKQEEGRWIVDHTCRDVNATYMFWSENEPNGYDPSEDCVAIQPTSRLMNDDGCGNKRAYICEKEPSR